MYQGKEERNPRSKEVSQNNQIMGISVELYRIRIGTFGTNKPRKMKPNKRRREKFNKISILIFSILILQLGNGCYQPRSDFIKTAKLVRPKHNEIDQEETKLYSWA